MKKFALLALTLGCCGLGAALHTPVAQAKPQSVSITSVVMARGYNGSKATGVTKVFKPSNRKIHCVVELNRVATVTAKGAWYAVDAAGMHNFKIVEASLPKQLASQLHFNASLPRDWPVGKYRVDIYVNGKMMRSVPYSIAK
ncbi:hypothetical protein IAD21_02260 [Abditibacteriota bacterium]|nr:hypothetical protein IAD21_02260 [Abditibacteriota bacterium]